MSLSNQKWQVTLAACLWTLFTWSTCRQHQPPLPPTTPTHQIHLLFYLHICKWELGIVLCIFYQWAQDHGPIFLNYSIDQIVAYESPLEVVNIFSLFGINAQRTHVITSSSGIKWVRSTWTYLFLVKNTFNCTQQIWNHDCVCQDGKLINPKCWFCNVCMACQLFMIVHYLNRDMDTVQPRNCEADDR